MLMLGNRWGHEWGAHAHKQRHANEGESLHAGLPGY
jgi:hypothetical protein